uniref:Uncharacterized protein n=1 Tax=Tetranychus urticae TaxID=32264 RepID=T1KU69_TETUR
MLMDNQYFYLDTQAEAVEDKNAYVKKLLSILLATLIIVEFLWLKNNLLEWTNWLDKRKMTVIIIKTIIILPKGDK